MNKERMMAKIAEASKMKIMDEEERMAAIEREKDAIGYRILALAPRIGELLEVAQELDRNGFPLGEKAGAMGTPTFVTEGINHRIGFYTKSSPYFGKTNLEPYAIGIEGGGACGTGLVVSQDGIVIKGLMEHGHINWYAKEFLAKFDEFERQFCEYVESL